MTVKNIKGREERPIKESQKEGGGLQPEEKPLEKPYLRPGLGRAEQRSLPAHGSNIRTSQLTQPRVWGSKMIKCCLVWVQSNKSSLTEVTLSLEQVCRSICQGSERANAENRCAVPFGGVYCKVHERGQDISHLLWDSNSCISPSKFME